MNSPISMIDIDGQSASPIYNKEGDFLGTDDQGLQGKAIVMDEENFKPSMSHEDAINNNLGAEGLSNDDAMNKLLEHKSRLKDRPDWDGKLTFKEANDWYRDGNGQPLFVALDKIDLSFLVSFGEKYVGQKKATNLLLSSNSTEDWLIYGTITLKRYSNHRVRAYADEYDFGMQNKWNPLNWPRNLQTKIGHKFAGKGNDYEINIYGSTKLKPVFPWIK